MRSLILIPAVLVTSCLAASGARADQFIVRNKGDKPIYRLFAWPSDFMPRSLSLIVAPIYPGQQATVEVENNWDKCEITFQADRNEKKRKGYGFGKLGIPFDYTNLDWCMTKSHTVDMPPPDRPD